MTAKVLISILWGFAICGCGKPTFLERKAPPGTFYLREGLSQTNEFGVSRLVAGTEVVFVSGEGELITVRAPDGEVWKAPVHQLTDDLDLRDQILQSREVDHRILAGKSLQARQIEAARDAETLRLSRESAQERKEKCLARVRSDLAALGARIAAAEREIEQKRITPIQSRSSYGSGSWEASYRTRTIAALSPDASQIENLRTAYRQMEAQLRQMESAE